MAKKADPHMNMIKKAYLPKLENRENANQHVSVPEEQDLSQFISNVPLIDIANEIDGGTQSYDRNTIPDMLQPDFTLESKIAAGDEAAKGEWLGFLCAVILNGNTVQASEYAARDLATNDQYPLFMRALGKNLLMRRVASFTLYTVTVGTEQTAIGYYYSDGHHHYCPAACITSDVSACVQTGCFDGRNMRFIDPTESLKKEGNWPQARAARNAVDNLKSDLPDQKMMEAATAFVQEINNTLRPQNDQNGDDQNGDAQNQAVELRPWGGTGGLTEAQKKVASWFAPKLLVMGSNSDFSGCVHATCDGDANLGKKVLFPLSKQFVDDLAAEKVQNGVGCFDNSKIKQAEAGYIISFEYDNASYRVTYGEGDCVDAGEQRLPYIAVWPNEETARWDKYYTYIYWNNQKHSAAFSFETVDFFSDPNANNTDADANNTDADANNTDADANNTLTVRYSKGGWQRSNEVREVYDEVIPTSGAPKAIKVTFDKNEWYLLPKLPGANVDAANNVLAVDFGSTNTIAYAKLGSNNPAHVNIGTQLFKVCGGEDNDRNVAITLNFAPPVSFDHAQFMTLLSTFGNHNANGHTVQDNSYKIWEESTIPFTDEITLNSDRQNISHNLKWNSREDVIVDANEKEKTKAFLKQLIEIYNWKINAREFRFAVPSSMNVDARNALKNCFTNALPPNAIVRYCTEAQAVGGLISHEKFNPHDRGYKDVTKENGYLVIDVGGGTVDYSLWQAPDNTKPVKLKEEASLIGVAGNFITRDKIMNKDGEPNISLLKELFNISADSTRRSNNLKENDVIMNLGWDLIEYVENCANMDANGKKEAYKKFELAWSTRFKTINQQLITRTQDAAFYGRNNLASFVSDLELYFCLLLFFAGMMTGSSIKLKRFKTLEKEDGKFFSVAFAGNGSTLLKLIPGYSTKTDEGGTPFIESSLHKKLVKCFMAGLKAGHEGGDAPDFNLQVLEPLKPKEEVAYGLCLMASKDMIQASEKNAEVKIEKNIWLKASGKDIATIAQAFANACQCSEEKKKALKVKATSIQNKIDNSSREHAFQRLIENTLQ